MHLRGSRKSSIERTGRRWWFSTLGILALGSVTLGSAACSEVPGPGARAPDEAPLSKRLEPSDLMPADLDVVVRLDLERMKQGLGAEPQAQVASRVATDPLVSKALVDARRVTLGLRASDLAHGDHVVVVETDVAKLEIPDDFESVPSRNDTVKILVRSVGVARTETQAIVILDDRAIAFVSPVETDSVLRVLREGADEERGDPAREGLVSLDVRTHRLDPALERKFPSISRLVRDLRRIRGVAEVREDGLGFDVEIVAKSAEAADRAARFLEALRAGAKGDGAAGAFASMRIDPLDARVRVRLTVPAAVVLGAIRDEADPSAGLHAPEVEGTTNVTLPEVAP